MLLNPMMPGESDRVRRNTRPDTLAQIDSKIEENIRYYATQPTAVIARRIEQLEQEWSVERWIETNAASLALAGLLLSVTTSRKWILLSGGVLGFLLLHATQGWCPPVPLLRKLGIRTRGEIERERYALKFLRGDFRSIPSNPEELKRSPATDVYNAIRV